MCVLKDKSEQKLQKHTVKDDILFLELKVMQT